MTSDMYYNLLKIIYLTSVSRHSQEYSAYITAASINMPGEIPDHPQIADIPSHLRY